MRSVIEVFWQIVLAITGALAASALLVAGGAFALGCVAFGCSIGWRRWCRRRRP